jgi:outer membrane lipoprotein-sorting protein
MSSLDRNLESFAALEPPPDLVEAAQRKLEARLADAPDAARRTMPARGWIAAAASAAVVAMVALWMPLNPTPAFAQVQKHFQNFSTLAFEVEERMNGNVIMQSRTSLRADGSARTEVGDVVVVVNPGQQRVLTLLRSAKLAVESPLTGTVTEDDSLRWLDEIRDFRGQARRLPDTRIIRGETAHGWELPLGQGNIVLWATEAGVPLEMQLDQGVSIEISFRFEFDPVLPAELFDTGVPPGYTLQQAED